MSNNQAVVKIGLLSDTHGYIDDEMLGYFAGCDEIWHAGDIGDTLVTEKIAAFKPLRAVYGNIDSGILRKSFPEDQIFDCAGLKVWITHIGAFPPAYNGIIKKKLADIKPGLFICGHSHILRVIPDKERALLHMNPGAAGHHGFHKVRTMLRFEVSSARVANLEVIELGVRGRIRE